MALYGISQVADAPVYGIFGWGLGLFVAGGLLIWQNRESKKQTQVYFRVFKKGKPESKKART